MSRLFVNDTDQISFGDYEGLSGATSISIAFWLWLNNLQDGGIISKWGNLFAEQAYLVTVVNSNEIMFACHFNQQFQIKSSNDANLQTNTWYPVVITFTAPNTVQIYVNNQLKSITTTSNNNVTQIDTSSRNLEFGLETDENRASARMRLAEVAFWRNAVLTQNEVRAYSNGNLPRPSNLNFYAPLWGIQSPEPQFVATGFTGTIVSGTSFETHPPVRLFNQKRLSSATAPIIETAPELEVEKTTDGLLLFEDFENLDGWTVPTGWFVDTSNPIYIAYPSTVDLLVGSAIGGEDGSGPREGHLMVINESLWYLFYGAGDGNNSGPNAPWRPKLAKSIDRGISWTKLGDVAGITNGTYAARDMSGFVWLDNGTYYLHVLNATAQSNGIPAGNYINAVYSSTDLEGTWTFIRESPTIGGSGEFDEQAVVVGWEEKIGSTYHVYYSARTAAISGVSWTIGHATSNDPDGPYTKDGGDNYLASNVVGVTISRPENPKKWYSSVLNKHVIVANSVNSSAEKTDGNDSFYSDSQTNFEGSDVYRSRLQSILWSGHDGVNAVGLISPFVNEDGTVVDINGYVPFTWDADPPSSFNGSTNAPGYHRGRKIRQGVLEPSPFALKMVDGINSELAVHPLSNHDDFIAEFALELFSSVTDKSVGFAYRMSADNGDNFNGYLFLWDIAASAIVLYKNTGGTYTNLTSAAHTMQKDIDTRNLVVQRIKIVVSGNNHKIYLNGSSTPFINHNDSTYASGNYVAIRGNIDCRIRRLSIYQSNTVTVNGLQENDSVIIRGHGGVVIAATIANASGQAVLSNVHYPLYSIEVEGIDYPIDNLIWGGDVYQFNIASGTQDINQTLILNQQVTVNRIINATANNSLNFEQQGARVILGNGSNTLNLAQTTIFNRLINQNVNQSLSIVQSLIRDNLTFTRTVLQTLNLQQTVVGNRTIQQQDINQSINFAQNVVKVIDVSASNMLNLNQTIDRVRVVDVNTYNILQMTQVASRNMSYNRLINQQLIFKKNEFISPINGETIVLPNATFTLVNDENLYLMFESGQHSIVLWNPEFGDTEGLNSELVLKRTLNNNVYTFIKKNQLRSFRYEFELGRNKAIELQQFLKNTAGDKIFLKNWKNEIWFGNVLSQPINFTMASRFEDEREKAELAIEFSGVRVN